MKEYSKVLYGGAGGQGISEVFGAKYNKFSIV